MSAFDWDKYNLWTRTYGLRPYGISVSELPTAELDAIAQRLGGHNEYQEVMWTLVDQVLEQNTRYVRGLQEGATRYFTGGFVLLLNELGIRDGFPPVIIPNPEAITRLGYSNTDRVVTSLTQQAVQIAMCFCISDTHFTHKEGRVAALTQNGQSVRIDSERLRTIGLERQVDSFLSQPARV